MTTEDYEHKYDPTPNSNSNSNRLSSNSNSTDTSCDMSDVSIIDGSHSRSSSHDAHSTTYQHIVVCEAPGASTLPSSIIHSKRIPAHMALNFALSVLNKYVSDHHVQGIQGGKKALQPQQASIFFKRPVNKVPSPRSATNTSPAVASPITTNSNSDSISTSNSNADSDAHSHSNPPSLPSVSPVTAIRYSLCLEYPSIAAANTVREILKRANIPFRSYTPKLTTVRVGPVHLSCAPALTRHICDAMPDAAVVEARYKSTDVYQNALCITLPTDLKSRLQSILHPCCTKSPRLFVNEYTKSVTFCTRCLAVGSHTLKYCSAPMAKCMRCGSCMHKSSECTTHNPPCLICSGPERVTHNTTQCKKSRHQQEFLYEVSHKPVSSTMSVSGSVQSVEVTAVSQFPALAPTSAALSAPSVVQSGTTSSPQNASATTVSYANAAARSQAKQQRRRDKRRTLVANPANPIHPSAPASGSASAAAPPLDLSNSALVQFMSQVLSRLDALTQAVSRIDALAQALQSLTVRVERLESQLSSLSHSTDSSASASTTPAAVPSDTSRDDYQLVISTRKRRRAAGEVPMAICDACKTQYDEADFIQGCNCCASCCTKAHREGCLQKRQQLGLRKQQPSACRTPLAPCSTQLAGTNSFDALSDTVTEGHDTAVSSSAVGPGPFRRTVGSSQPHSHGLRH